MFAADSKQSSASLTDRLDAAQGLSWKQIIGPVEPFLGSVAQGLSAQVDSFDPALAPYAEYSLSGEGKHLRPALVGLTANALGKWSDAHITVGVIIEMVHLATLIHDDIMDEAEIRRGRLTLASNWGNEVAVLFGDCLFAQALKLAASFPTTDICRAVASATNTVCSGEIIQTQRRRDFQFTRENYFNILEMKTAELFALSCELSAFLSATGTEQRVALRQFGLAFGTAYQVYDDCIDIFGSETSAGKSLGTDLAKGKLTLPILLLWERANGADRRQLEEFVQNWDNSSLAGVTGLLNRYETLPSCVQVVQQYLQRARHLLLHSLPTTAGRAGLLGVTHYLSRQTEALADGA
jgi:octaprenyl-diphosphate synthase